MTTNPSVGSSLDSLLEEDGVLDEVEAAALNRFLDFLVDEQDRELLSGVEVEE